MPLRCLVLRRGRAPRRCSFGPAGLIASGVFECAHKIYGSLGPAFYGLRTSLLTLLLDGAVAHQTPGGPQGILAPGPGAGAGAGSGAGGQNPAAQTGSDWRPADGRPSLVRLWPNSGSPRGDRTWASFTSTATCGSTTASIGCPKRTWPRCACRCRPPPTIGSTTGRRSLVRADRRGQRGHGQDAAWRPGPGARDCWASAALRWCSIAVAISPKLFQQIIAAGFDLLTYRKGRYPRIPRKRFRAHRTRVEGQTPPMSWPTRRCVYSRASCACAR